MRVIWTGLVRHCVNIGAEPVNRAAILVAEKHTTILGTYLRTHAGLHANLCDAVFCQPKQVLGEQR